MPYATVSDVRLEGVPESLFDDDVVERRLAYAQSMIEAYTGRFFEPRELEVRLDGNGSSCLFLHDPIIAIAEIQIDLVPGDESSALPIALDDVAIYNRHLREHLSQPDDRDNPKIEFLRVSDGQLLRASPLSASLTWPRGKQNVYVSGTFGYTDFAVGEDEGITPPLIRDATIRLAIRYMRQKWLTTDDNGMSTGSAGPVMEMRTREQWVKYNDTSKLATQGAFTGDPEIDTIIARYRRPIAIGVA